MGTKKLSLSEIQLSLFDGPEAPKVVENYIRFNYLSPPAQEKLFELPNAASIVKQYVRRGLTLSDESQKLLFELPTREQILLFFIKRYRHRLTAEAQLRLFELKHAKAFLKIYAEDRPLCPQAQVKLFDLFSPEELLSGFIRWDFCEQAQLMLFEVPDAEKIVKEYIQKTFFTSAAQLKLTEMPNSSELMYLYVRKGWTLRPETQMKVLDYPYGADLLNLYQDLGHRLEYDVAECLQQID